MPYLIKEETHICLVFLKTIVICLSFFMFQSCDNSDMPVANSFRKEASIYFEGNTERVFPWVSFVAYTENHEPLYIILNRDTTINNNGVFSISRGKIPQSGKIVLYSDFKGEGWIYLGITYRKRMEKPSKADELRIKIQGYTDEVLNLDTMQTMRAFRSDEKINESNYIYKLKI